MCQDETLHGCKTFTVGWPLANEEPNSFITAQYSNCLQTQMRDQEKKLRKVKEILAKDSCASTHTPLQPTKSATTQSQTPVASERYNINTRGLPSQGSKRVCTSNKLVANRKPWFLLFLLFFLPLKVNVGKAFTSSLMNFFNCCSNNMPFYS